MEFLSSISEVDVIVGWLNRLFRPGCWAFGVRQDSDQPQIIQHLHDIPLLTTDLQIVSVSSAAYSLVSILISLLHVRAGWGPIGTR